MGRSCPGDFQLEGIHLFAVTHSHVISGCFCVQDVCAGRARQSPGQDQLLWHVWVVAAEGECSKAGEHWVWGRLVYPNERA